MVDDVAEGWHDGVAILFAICLVVNTSAYNDFNQSKQFRALNKDKKNLQITVVRDSRRVKVSIHDLVVGDVVVVSLGDQVPADGLLMSGMSVVRRRPGGKNAKRKNKVSGGSQRCNPLASPPPPPPLGSFIYVSPPLLRCATRRA